MSLQRELKTVVRRLRSDIRMDDSVRESYTSLEIDFIEENGCKTKSEFDLMG